MGGITWQVAFFSLLLLLSLMHVIVFYVVCINSFCPFFLIAEKYFIIGMCHGFIIHSLIERYLGCF